MGSPPPTSGRRPRRPRRRHPSPLAPCSHRRGPAEHEVAPRRRAGRRRQRAVAHPHVEKGILLLYTPTFFNPVAVPFDYDPDAGDPVRWFFEFLGELWPDDLDAVDALEEFFWYLHPDLRPHRPPQGADGRRAMCSGSSTWAIAGLHRLRSRGVHRAGPTPPASAPTSVSRLLVDREAAGRHLRRPARRHQPPRRRRTAALHHRRGRAHHRHQVPGGVDRGAAGTRGSCVLSNELPVVRRLRRCGPAPRTWFIVLVLTELWLGREDATYLGPHPAGELPGILNWALDGFSLAHRPGAVHRAGLSSVSRRPSPRAGRPRLPGRSVRPRPAARAGSATRCLVRELFNAWKDWCRGQRPQARHRADASAATSGPSSPGYASSAPATVTSASASTAASSLHWN